MPAASENGCAFLSVKCRPAACSSDAVNWNASVICRSAHSRARKYPSGSDRPTQSALHSVVEEMREADAGEHDIGRPRHGALAARPGAASATITGVVKVSSETTVFFGEDNGLVQRRIPKRIR